MRLPWLPAAILIGMGATVTMDAWALLLRRAFGIRSLDLCLLGRWVLHFPRGIVVHEGISSAPARRHECAVGWSAHYLVGTTFALAFVLLATESWLRRPTLLPALAFGIVTVAVPFFTVQPALGLGIASSRTARPHLARLKSLMTHAVFGVGLWISGTLLSRVVP